MKRRYEKPLTVEELAALPDDRIDTGDIPELGPDFWARARVTPPRARPPQSK